MTDEKTPLDQALELLVFAPIGLALTARDELPKLIERGRQQVTGQVAMAKMIGQFAVAQGQREAEKVVKQAGERLGDLGLGGRPAPSSAPATTSAASAPSAPSAPKAPTPPSAGNGSSATPAPAVAAPVPGTAATRTSAASPSDDHLAIPGYDALSASQVVQRLAGLSSVELEAVRAYEAGNRGRKTVLHRISQLQASA